MSKTSMRISKTSSRGSVVGSKYKAGNDYRLGPIKKFQLAEVEKILQERTELAFEGLTHYDFDDMSVASKFLTTDILTACNDLRWPAFKIVVTVKCVEASWQTARGVLRYYWDPMDDGLAFFLHKTVSYYVAVTAAFLYYE